MTGRTPAGVAASAVGADAVWLQYTPWRVSCARCGVKVNPTRRAGAVADGSSVFTAAVEELAAYLAQVTDPTTVSRLLGGFHPTSTSPFPQGAQAAVESRPVVAYAGGEVMVQSAALGCIKRPSGAGKTEIPAQKENRTQWRQRQTQKS